MAMDPELKAEWVARLRSGDYEQGSNWLNQVTQDGNKLCCIGVLAEIAVARNMCQRAEPSASIVSYFISGVAPGLRRTCLGIHLRESLGLSAYHENTLIGMNDNGCLSFAEIADYIENNQEL